MAKTKNAVKTATKTEKEPKVKTPAQLEKMRKSQDRKRLTVEMRSLERINTQLEKTVKVFSEQLQKVSDGAQLSEILNQLNLAVTVVEASVTEKATALARTFVK